MSVKNNALSIQLTNNAFDWTYWVGGYYLLLLLLLLSQRLGDVYWEQKRMSFIVEGASYKKHYFYLFIYLLGWLVDCLFQARCLCVAMTGLKFRDPHACASQVLRLKACTPTNPTGKKMLMETHFKHSLNK